MTPEALSAFAHAVRVALARSRPGAGPSELGRILDMSKQYGKLILDGGMEPNRAKVFEMEAAFGLPPGGLSHLLGYLPVGASSVEVAIMADPLLGPDEKATVIEVYRASVELGRDRV